MQVENYKDPIHINATWHLSMDHISGNKSAIGSIEVPIDREYPDEEPIKFPYITIHFLRTWLAFKVRKCKKEALKGPDR
jgi:hypothetical protein